MEFDLEQLVRPNIRDMAPYSSARHEFSGEARVFLDANENAIGSPVVFPGTDGHPLPLNRYPDPLQMAIKEKLSKIKGVPPQHIFLGNGSDEAIDLLFRIFCTPGKDNVIIFPPTYGMYEVCADMNHVALKKIPLLPNYQLPMEELETAIDANTKLIFICSPNNPTGNSMLRDDIILLLNNFSGLVVIDEAYINFARQRSFIAELTEYPNLVVLQTLSKAWGLAGLRLGMAFGSTPLIGYMNKVKYPYNISIATQELVLRALDNSQLVNEWIVNTVQQREWLAAELSRLALTQTIYPSDANFLLVKMTGAVDIYEYLCRCGIIVRDRSKVILCDDCLRITIGTAAENQELIQALQRYKA